MKNSIFTVLAALSCCIPPGRSPSPRRTGRRAAELVERMTLDEKIGQLVQQRGGGAVTGPDKTELSVERLVREGRCGSVFNIKSFEETERLQRIAVEESADWRIPLLFGADVIHGLRTIFPINLGTSPPRGTLHGVGVAGPRRRARRSASGHALDVLADGATSPRDPRWGRVSEGRGRRPLPRARVIADRDGAGLPGNDSSEALASDTTILACVKHFAAYGAPEAGRDYHAVRYVTERALRDSLPAALPEGGASTPGAANGDGRVQRPRRRAGPRPAAG